MQRDRSIASTTCDLELHVIAASSLLNPWRTVVEHGQSVVTGRHKEEPVLDARDGLVVLQVEVHVVDRTLGDPSVRVARGEQVRERELLPAFVLRRETDEIR